jgi:ABC-type transport system involved in cytochrome bd biosynthesis fused ATPase/permease subunit
MSKAPSNLASATTGWMTPPCAATGVRQRAGGDLLSRIVRIETLEQLAVRVPMPSAAAVLAGIAASAFLAFLDAMLGLVLAVAWHPARR